MKIAGQTISTRSIVVYPSNVLGHDNHHGHGSRVDRSHPTALGERSLRRRRATRHVHHGLYRIGSAVPLPARRFAAVHRRSAGLPARWFRPAVGSPRRSAHRRDSRRSPGCATAQTDGSSSRPTSSKPRISSTNTGPSRSSFVASCPSCAPMPRWSRVWRA